MSVFLFEKEYCLLEPCEGKLSRTVLRGESTRKGADLPDHFIIVNRSCSVCIDKANVFGECSGFFHCLING